MTNDSLNHKTLKQRLEGLEALKRATLPDGIKDAEDRSWDLVRWKDSQEKALSLARDAMALLEKCAPYVGVCSDQWPKTLAPLLAKLKEEEIL